MERQGLVAENRFSLYLLKAGATLNSECSDVLRQAFLRIHLYWPQSKPLTFPLEAEVLPAWSLGTIQGFYQK